MKYCFFVCVLILLCSCESPVSEERKINTDNLSDFVTASYLENVYHIYGNKILSDTTHSQWDNPVFDVDSLEAILHAIDIVFSSGIPEADSVFGESPIRSISIYYDYRKLSFYTQESREEYQALKNNQIPDTEPDTKRILQKYGYTNVKYREPRFDTGYLNGSIEADKPHFGPAVIREIKEYLPYGSGYVEGNYSIGDGSEVFWVTPSSDITYITFQKAWGDCPAGCINSKSWVFKIADDKAEFISEYKSVYVEGENRFEGEPLPDKYRY